MAFDNIPGVDDEFNFPEPIRQAFANSIQFRQALLLSLTGSDSPLAEVLDALAIEPTSALVTKLQELSAEYTGETGADGAMGPAGSGVGPVVLGEKVMTANSNAVTDTITDWTGFNLTITKGTKPYVIKVDTHLQASAGAAPATLVLAVYEGSALIQQWNTRAYEGSVAYHLHGETVTLNPAAGSHTYKVRLRTTHGTGTVIGVSTSLAGGYPSYMKVIEQ